jgi:uncharacterized phage-associated protein
MAISFRPNQSKILEALVLAAKERPGIDVLHLCKVFYFADKRHLNEYGRPIFGDKYWALPQGPVPSLTYDMIERDEVHLDGMTLQQLSEALSFYKAAKDKYLRLKAKRSPDLNVFSESDLECLYKAIATYADMPPDELAKIVHDEPAYKAVWKSGRTRAAIAYEQILDSRNPHYRELLQDLTENAAHILL